MTDIKFIVGEIYSDFIKVVKRTDKTIVAERMDSYVPGTRTHSDSVGEHRYKINIDCDGTEYTVIDRFTSARGERWGKVISADPDKNWYLMKL